MPLFDRFILVQAFWIYFIRRVEVSEKRVCKAVSFSIFIHTWRNNLTCRTLDLKNVRNGHHFSWSRHFTYFRVNKNLKNSKFTAESSPVISNQTSSNCFGTTIHGSSANWDLQQVSQFFIFINTGQRMEQSSLEIQSA